MNISFGFSKNADLNETQDAAGLGKKLIKLAIKMVI